MAETRPPSPNEQFVSEPIRPEPGSFSTELLAQGLAAPPAAFTWRGRRYEIVECLSHEKLTSREGGSAQGERYLRRQRFEVRLDTGEIAKIDLDRHTLARRGSRAAKERWYLYTIRPGSIRRAPPA